MIPALSASVNPNYLTPISHQSSTHSSPSLTSCSQIKRLITMIPEQEEQDFGSPPPAPKLSGMPRDSLVQ